MTVFAFRTLVFLDLTARWQGARSLDKLWAVRREGRSIAPDTRRPDRWRPKFFFCQDRAAGGRDRIVARGYKRTFEGALLLVRINPDLVINRFGNSIGGNLTREQGPSVGVAGFMLHDGIYALASLIITVGFVTSGLLLTFVTFALLCLCLMLANLVLARLPGTGMFELFDWAIGRMQLRVCCLMVALVLIFVTDKLAAYYFLIGLRPLEFLAALWLLSTMVYCTLALRAGVRRDQPDRISGAA